MLSDKESTQDLIDIAYILGLLRKNIYLILSITGVCIAGSIFYSLTATHLYSSSAIVQINQNNGSINSTGNEATLGLAAFAGINLNAGPTQESLVNETIRSRDFFNYLISNSPTILPNLIAFDHYDSLNQATVFNKELYDPSSEQFLNFYTNQELFYDGIRAYHGVFSVSENKNGYLLFTSTHESPYFAKFLIDESIKYLNKMIREKHLNETTQALSFLQIQLSKTPIIDIKNSINRLIESQLERQMLAYSNDDYIITPLDKAYVPLERSFPQRTRIVIEWSLLGFVLAFLIIFLKDLIYPFFLKEKSSNK